MRNQQCVLVLALILSALAADGFARRRPVQTSFEPTTNYKVMEVEGWKVYVNKRLLSEKKELYEKAMKVLRSQLLYVDYRLPQNAVKELKKITVWLDDKKAGPVHYHPDIGWLKANNHNPDKAKCVDISRAADFVRASRDQPCVMLHELSHAYHHQVLGFNDPRIIEAFNNARTKGNYKTVLWIDGRRRPHYAMTNHKEYFAEVTEAFFGTNDFYPFVRGELKQHDPGVYKLLGEVWKGPEARLKEKKK